jgi:dephospho-CoA kinase
MLINSKFIIGLTGNIACGKSTVLNELQRLGAQVIDADAVTRSLQQPGQPVLQAIVAHFGTHILNADGTLDRATLGRIVFADTEQLRQLEAIVHPAVRAHILQWLASLPSDRPVVGVIDAIKLIENGWPAHCHEVWVVTCPRELQIMRLMQTRGLSESDARLRVDAQAPQSAKIAVADVVIDNAGSLTDTIAQVAHHWQRIQSLLVIRSTT